MAPSHVVVALLVAFAVASPAAQATRAHGEAAAAAPAPGEAVLHLSATPLIPLIPCSMVPDIPIIKDILRLICYDDKPTPPPTPPSPPPKSCRAPLVGMTKPCGAFLTTNASASAPPAGCCDGYLGVISQEAVCICRIANGDIAKLLPAPVNMTRVFALPKACGSPIHLETFTNCEALGLKVPPVNDPDTPPSAH